MLCSAGMRPVTRPVTNVSDVVNSRMRQSASRFSETGTGTMPTAARSKPPSTRASHQPGTRAEREEHERLDDQHPHERAA